jgi:hypothetical protein
VEHSHKKGAKNRPGFGCHSRYKRFRKSFTLLTVTEVIQPFCNVLHRLQRNIAFLQRNVTFSLQTMHFLQQFPANIADRTATLNSKNETMQHFRCRRFAFVRFGRRFAFVRFGKRFAFVRFGRRFAFVSFGRRFAD